MIRGFCSKAKTVLKAKNIKIHNLTFPEIVLVKMDRLSHKGSQPHLETDILAKHFQTNFLQKQLLFI